MRSVIITPAKCCDVEWQETISFVETNVTRLRLMRRYKEQTRGMEGDRENREEDKKFLYHKITLSSSDVIFYVPIYASRRAGRQRAVYSLVVFREGGGGLLRYKMKEARVERGCSRAEIEEVSRLSPPLPPWRPPTYEV